MKKTLEKIIPGMARLGVGFAIAGIGMGIFSVGVKGCVSCANNHFEEMKDLYVPHSLTYAGDLNKDGYDDFIVSTKDGDYVFYGREDRRYIRGNENER